MRYLGLDLGTKTLGISMTDKTNTLVSPFKVIHFKSEDYASTISEVVDIINKYGITKVVLGLPKNMDGTIGFAGERSLNYEKLLKSVGIDVVLYDERLTSVMAIDIVHQNNENIKNTKGKIDKIAASIILESYLRSSNDFTK